MRTGFWDSSLLAEWEALTLSGQRQVRAEQEF
jgi:hypothetical protein